MRSVAALTSLPPGGESFSSEFLKLTAGFLFALVRTVVALYLLYFVYYRVTDPVSWGGEFHDMHAFGALLVIGVFTIIVVIPGFILGYLVQLFRLNRRARNREK